MEWVVLARDEACRSVRLDKSMFPLAISAAASAIDTVPLRTLSTMERRPSFISAKAASS